MRHATPILHADADAFFAAVEQRDDPALRGRPVIVGGGVVMAASYEARRHGVRSAMPGGRARALCPDAVVVTPRWEAYVEAGRAMFAIFERSAPAVQRLSMEEAFLDLRGSSAGAAPAELAARLRRDVREQVGLCVSVGVARTRILAKLASRAAKPDGLVVVEPAGELAFLHSLRVEDLWGVGPATAAKLHAHGLRTVGQVAEESLRTLVAFLGPAAGRQVHALANNLDTWPSRPGRGRRSVGAQRALGRGGRSARELDAVLVELVERVTRRMARSALLGRTVTLRLRFGDYTRVTRSHTLSFATADAEPVLAALRELLAAAAEAVHLRGLTLLGVTVANLDGDPRQLTLAVDDTLSWPPASSG